MRLSIVAVCTALLLTSAPGCFRVELVAPYGMDVTLISSEEPVEVERRWRTFYIVWGYTPLTNHMPEELIHREQLTEVRLITEDNIPDALHGILYNVIINIGLVNQTLVLQGNRAPAGEGVAEAVEADGSTDRVDDGSSRATAPVAE